MAPSYLIASSSDICLCFIWRPLERKNRFSGWTRTDGAVIESPQAPYPHSRGVVRLRFCGRASMRHRIITTELRTDLMVTTIALGAVAVCAVIGFMFALVIAPF